MNMKTGIGALIGIAVIVLVVFLAKNHKVETALTDITPTNEATTSQTTATTTETTPAVTEGKTTKTKDGLEITVIKEGTGEAAKVGDTVLMNYTGKLMDGTVFDSNVDANFHHTQPFPFTLGQNRVIQGWEQGVLGMKKGEKRRLTIPSALAYGPMGQGPIPANATLIFDVELLGINGK